VLDLGHERRRHADLVHAQPEQQRREEGSLAIRRRPPSRCRGRGASVVILMRRTPRVGRLIEVGILELSGPRPRVLDEIVGAEAEELDAAWPAPLAASAAEGISIMTPMSICSFERTPAAQLLPALPHQVLAWLSSSRPTPRVTSLDVAQGAGARWRGSLEAETGPFRAGRSGSPAAQERVHFRRQLQVGNELVPAQVQGADDEPGRVERRRHVLIGLYALPRGIRGG